MNNQSIIQLNIDDRYLPKNFRKQYGWIVTYVNQCISLHDKCSIFNLAGVQNFQDFQSEISRIFVFNGENSRNIPWFMSRNYFQA